MHTGGEVDNQIGRNAGESLISNKTVYPKITLKNLERLIVSALGDRKAEQVLSIDLTGKSDVADRMVIASGTSARHVASLSDAVVDALKEAGYEHIPVEGKDACEWVLVDAGDIIVHLFKPDARQHYNLEKMWSVSLPKTAESVG
ncbi:MAG: ribosome silencing factor [Alphaproteobacteria bacterium]|nr:ribosome silencing factor [Alphaproteobacteria bacterium]